MKDKCSTFPSIGLKVNVDSRKNIINSDFILGIINDITLISNLLTEGDRFIAGYHLGRLQGDLVFLMEQLEVKEKEEENLVSWKEANKQDRYQDSEEEEEEEDDFEDLKIELEKKEDEIREHKNCIMDMSDFLINLLRMKKIKGEDYKESLCLLRRAGVQDCDIKLRIDQIIQ